MPATTLLYNAVSYSGNTLTGPGIPIPGLLSTRNRTFELGEAFYNQTIATNIVNGNNSQGMALTACLANSSPSHCAFIATQWPTLTFELGNEIDFGGDAVKAGKLWAAQESAILSVAPSANIVIGNIQSLSGHGLGTMRVALEAYQRRPTTISVHVYTDAQPVTQVVQRLEWFRGVLRSFWQPEPIIWVTEFGDPNFTSWDETTQTTWMTDMLVAFDDAGIAESFWWAADDNGGFGTSDRERLKRIWNTAKTTAGV